MRKSFISAVLLFLVCGLLNAEVLSAFINGKSISINDTKADIIETFGEPEDIYTITTPGFIYMETLEVLAYDGFEMYFQNKDTERLVMIRMTASAENARVREFVAGKTTVKEIDEILPYYVCYPDREGETYRFEEGKHSKGGICLYTEKGLCKEITVALYPFLK